MPETKSVAAHLGEENQKLKARICELESQLETVEDQRNAASEDCSRYFDESCDLGEKLEEALERIADLEGQLKGKVAQYYHLLTEYREIMDFINSLGPIMKGFYPDKICTEDPGY